jgi:hypothetical protein
MIGTFKERLIELPLKPSTKNIITKSPKKNHKPFENFKINNESGFGCTQEEWNIME